MARGLWRVAIRKLRLVFGEGTRVDFGFDKEGGFHGWR